MVGPTCGADSMLEIQLRQCSTYVDNIAEPDQFSQKTNFENNLNLVFLTKNCEN